MEPQPNPEDPETPDSWQRFTFDGRSRSQRDSEMLARHFLKGAFPSPLAVRRVDIHFSGLVAPWAVRRWCRELRQVAAEQGIAIRLDRHLIPRWVELIRLPTHDEMPVEHVMLFPDYSAESPLFANGVMVHRDEMPGLGLSEELSDRLVEWQRLFDDNFGIDGEGWTDPAARAEWWAAADPIVADLRAELATRGVTLITNLWQRW